MNFKQEYFLSTYILFILLFVKQLIKILNKTKKMNLKKYFFFI